MLGMGVMLHRLGGCGEDELAIYNRSIGKTIGRVVVEDDVLRFSFTDGTTMTLKDMGQSCCENRHMNTDDKLIAFEGATLQGIEVRDGGSDDVEYGVTESQFLIVTTSAGVFTVANYNEHNGYYGGFALSVGE